MVVCWLALFGREKSRGCEAAARRDSERGPYWMTMLSDLFHISENFFSNARISSGSEDRTTLLSWCLAAAERLLLPSRNKPSVDHAFRCISARDPLTRICMFGFPAKIVLIYGFRVFSSSNCSWSR